jgi:hypothetical protein
MKKMFGVNNLNSHCELWFRERSRDFKSPLLRVEGTLNADGYKMFITNSHGIKNMNMRSGRKAWVFQDDRASVHRAGADSAICQSGNRFRRPMGTRVDTKTLPTASTRVADVSPPTPTASDADEDNDSSMDESDESDLEVGLPLHPGVTDRRSAVSFQLLRTEKLWAAQINLVKHACRDGIDHHTRSATSRESCASLL